MRALEKVMWFITQLVLRNSKWKPPWTPVFSSTITDTLLCRRGIEPGNSPSKGAESFTLNILCKLKYVIDKVCPFSSGSQNLWSNTPIGPPNFILNRNKVQMFCFIKWPIFTQTGKIGTGKTTKSLFSKFSCLGENWPLKLVRIIEQVRKMSISQP